MTFRVPASLMRYTRWLHTRWPAGTLEKLPQVAPDGGTNIPGLYVTGDLTGIPLLKFSAHTGARAVQAIAGDPAFQAARSGNAPGVQDLEIVILESPRGNWGIRGKVGDELQLAYRVET